jgi:CBS domain containing-hemolysin-like protein/mannitol/fructose-specific phosphotransferase system IIA component (Ntr-type)
MEIAIYLFAVVVLLLLNGFFVLAEFAVIKVRSSRVTEMIDQGNKRAKLVQEIQSKLDEYLSVCQVGITFASVALGMVGKKATDAIMGDAAGPGGDLTRYIIAMGVSYILVSGSHIVIGELVPKSIAIRVADRAALFSARPLRFFHILFFLPLWVLNRIANVILKMLGMPGPAVEDHHSEDELRILLEQSQTRGLLSFRRLLFLENVFDMGDLKVKDAMRPRSQVRFITTELHWTDTAQFIRTWRFSRYPLIHDDPEKPVGIIHVKDLFLGRRDDDETPDLLKLARPYLTTTDTTPLESLLVDMQRRFIHVALVHNAEGKWVGLISMEDIIEEIIGTVRDEFETEEPLSLAEAITPGRVVLDIDAPSMPDAIRAALARVPAGDLPMPIDAILPAVLERERLASTYLGRGLAMPHARLNGITKPAVVLVRSAKGIPLQQGNERAKLLFILLTPAGQPRTHQRLQARIAQLMDSSEYVEERIHDATTAQDLLEVIRTGEMASLG